MGKEKLTSYINGFRIDPLSKETLIEMSDCEDRSLKGLCRILLQKVAREYREKKEALNKKADTK